MKVLLEKVITKRKPYVLLVLKETNISLYYLVLDSPFEFNWQVGKVAVAKKYTFNRAYWAHINI